MIALLEAVLGSKVGRWAAEALVVLLLLGSAALYLEHRAAEGELAKLQKSSAALVEKANEALAAETEQHAKDVLANQEMTHAAVAIADALRGQLDDSVVQFDAYRRAHPDIPRPTGGSGPAVSGECGARDCGDVVEELAVRGNELAGSVGDLTAELQSCQRDRDSLTGLPR